MTAIRAASLRGAVVVGVVVLGAACSTTANRTTADDEAVAVGSASASIATAGSPAPALSPSSMPPQEPPQTQPGERLVPGVLAADDASAFFAVEPISEAVFARMEGKSWKPGAIPREQLRYLRLLYVGFDGDTYLGELVVNESIAADVRDIFAELYNAGYQIQRMVLVDEYGADDEASVAAGNTSSFNHRLVAGTSIWSRHSLGLAIDLNPIQNPWVSGDQVIPPQGHPYVDRASGLPHMIDHEDLAYRLFAARGFRWGGDWRTPKDFQHFEK